MLGEDQNIKKLRCVIIAFLLLVITPCKAFSISIETDSENNRYVVNMEVGKNFFEQEFFYEPEVLGSYTFTGNIIHVIQESPHGNACNGGDIYIIWINTEKTDDRKFKKSTRIINYCGGHEPEISLKDGSLKVYIKPYKSDRWGTEKTRYVPGSTWHYKPEWN